MFFEPDDQEILKGVKNSNIVLNNTFDDLKDLLELSDQFISDCNNFFEGRAQFSIDDLKIVDGVYEQGYVGNLVEVQEFEPAVCGQ